MIEPRGYQEEHEAVPGDPANSYIVVGVGDEGIHRFACRADFKAWVDAHHSHQWQDAVHRSKATVAGLQGQPLVKGLCGPMWDGDRVRYETWDAYNFYSA